VVRIVIIVLALLVLSGIVAAMFVTMTGISERREQRQAVRRSQLRTTESERDRAYDALGEIEAVVLDELTVNGQTPFASNVLRLTREARQTLTQRRKDTL